MLGTRWERGHGDRAGPGTCRQWLDFLACECPWLSLVSLTGAVPGGRVCRQKQRPPLPRPVPGHVEGRPRPHPVPVPRGEPHQDQPEAAPDSRLAVQGVRGHADEEPADQEPQLHSVLPAPTFLRARGGGLSGGSPVLLAQPQRPHAEGDESTRRSDGTVSQACLKNAPVPPPPPSRGLKTEGEGGTDI